MNFFILSFILLVLAFFISHYVKETFEESTCGQQTNCQSCAGANGCSWCSKTKQCLKSTTLSTKNANCNQNNTISLSFSCPSQVDPLYASEVVNRVAPPNVYTNPNMEYSNETVMAELHDVREQIKSAQAKLPDQIKQLLYEKPFPTHAIA